MVTITTHRPAQSRTKQTEKKQKQGSEKKSADRAMNDERREEERQGKQESEEGVRARIISYSQYRANVYNNNLACYATIHRQNIIELPTCLYLPPH